MSDAEVIMRLQSAPAGLTATHLAEYLRELRGGEHSAGAIVMFFHRAFPQIPLRFLIDAAGAWRRAGGALFTDDELNQHLAPWLGARATNSSEV